jgi:hypothetical protein
MLVTCSYLTNMQRIDVAHMIDREDHFATSCMILEGEKNVERKDQVTRSQRFRGLYLE